ncbi:sensor histidine kinase [Mucilaginibacter sp. SMC90]|uniref:sensor histidine kinase n=1 Tax=Mucilaginibacter sp. SMC90 TaxID=2929803 RepID=UPI001FB3DE61|nr:sensor histidine kinase [Mucilaginibacter sp. SMC90]UOE49231.1 sensor histidine kinase [Mucilaginibacter sp. SMC90]
MSRIKAKHIIEILIHLAFWIGVYYTLNSLTGSTVRVKVSQNGRVMEKSQIDTVFPYSRITLAFLALLFYGNIFWIFKKVLHYKSLVAGVAMAAGWFILIFMANYVFVVSKLSSNLPVVPPIPDFAAGKDGPDHLIQGRTAIFAIGNWIHMQLTMLLIFFTAAGLSIAYFFLKEWARNELMRNQLQAYQLSTEIKFLKSQINPHFLFNTLNNLFSMAQEKGNDELADGISKLSGMMRYMIYDSNAGSVPLSKEMAYLEDCITLNKLRYADDEVKVIFNHPAQTGNAIVAPMLFIPFVENAFKHGVSIGQTSVIDIGIALADQRLNFSCVNTKYSTIKKMEDEKSGIGLENVKRRLDLLYPNKHKLQISEDGGKYIVKLELDLE